MIGWLLGPIGRYVGLALIASALVGGYTLKVRRDAERALLEKLRAEENRRLNDALDADDRARRDAADPSRLRLDDGWRRAD